LHGTAACVVEKFTLTVCLIAQHEAASVAAQPRVLLDEFVFRQREKFCEARNLRVIQAHLPRPATAGGAMLAIVKNRHGASVVRGAAQPLVFFTASHGVTES
jgi:hypothetical protein